VDLEFRMNRDLCRILCLMLLLQVLLSAMEISIVVSQPAAGDWVVTGEEVVEDREIVLNGDLIAENGGNLTLRNVRLVMNCGYDGEFNIEVREGSMYIYDSYVTAADMKHRFQFDVGGDSVFVMRNSELHGCGWKEDQGLCIKDENARAIIEGNTISDGRCGIVLNPASNVVIANNVIIGGDFGILGWGCSYNNITNNIIAGCTHGLLLGGGSSGNIIYLNNFTDNYIGAEDEGIDNSWDYNGRGNYWSGYYGWDEDGDGIGDTPYNINPNGVDHYPLGPTRSEITFDLSATSITEGESVTITGSIHPNPGSVEVILEYSSDEGITWNKLASIGTDADGSYSYSWSPDTGSYRIRAKWAGNWCYRAFSNPIPKTLTVTSIISPTIVVGIAATLVVAIIGGYLFMKSRKPAPPKPPPEVKVKPPLKPPAKPPAKKEVLLLEELEEMYRSGRITETAYRRLKKKYEAEANSSMQD